MSQAGEINSGSGPVPPSVATSYVTNDGTAVPAANILIVHALDSSEDNVNGIITKGGVAGTGVSNEVDVVITNRLHGNVQTVGAVVSNVISFTPPATIGCYKLFYQIAAYDSTDVTGAGYELEGCVVSNGSGFATKGTPTRTMNGDTSVFDVTLVDVVISGGAIILQATGIAGKTIRWTAVLTFVFGGA